MAVKEIGEIDYHTIVVQMTNGKTFKTKSCWGKEGDLLKLDVDPNNHPAWKSGDQSFVDVKNDQIAKFNKKFGSFGNV
jgi:large subunit ribosomal protein L31